MDNKLEREIQADQPRKINMLNGVVIIARHKKMILRVVLSVFILSIISFWLLIPRWYKSTAVIMPPKQKNALGLMSTLSRATSSLRSLGLGSPSDDLAQFLTILGSRRVLEEVINRFDLQKVYDLETMEKTVKELGSNVQISTGKEEVSVEIVTFDTDPQRSADMANYFVEVLNKVYLEMSVAEAKSNREFLEKRYLQNLSDLRKAEEEFKAFQEKYSAYSVPEQLKAAVGVAATLQSQVALKEVELGIISRSTAPDNPSRQSIELELQELRKQLGTMKTGSSGRDANIRIFPPFDRAPEIGMEYFRRYRELEIQGKILELLMPLYEQSKIEEQRDTPSVIVLDSAVPAVKADKPKRAILTVLITMASFIMTFFIALLLDRSAQARDNRSKQENEKIAMIRHELHWRNLFR